ncbi:MAG: MFS transporter [Acidimicrobiales bacterium]|nr:MFS transporter [Acidimicrobiales bacterium]
MAVTERTIVVDEAGLAELRTARADLLVEAEAGPDRFVLATGPFKTYERELDVQAATGVASEGPPQYAVTERTTWQLALPVWWIVYWLPARYAITHRLGPNQQPWWAPPSRIDRQTAHVLGLLCTLAVFSGYLGSILSQTITFVTEEFGNDRSDQGVALATVRFGIPIAVGLLAAADRHGRRRLLLLTGVAASLVTATAVLAPNLVALTISQAIARAITTALGLLIGIVAAEELPAGSRAYGVSVLALTAALGSGGTVWLLPLADIDARLWRVVYLVPLLFVPAIIALVRRLPESRRFARSEDRPTIENFRHLWTEQRGRLILLALGAFLFLFFAAPASQFQNEFLRDERSFSASRITLFTICTSTPAGLGVFFGGRLADRRGRRFVGIAGVVGSAGFGVWSYFSTGPALWLMTLLAIVIGGMTAPALGVYLPELFSTRQRATANGLITTVGVVGSASGLFVVGWLADESRWNAFGPAFAVAAVAPMLYALLIWRRYPETARRELEDLNPVDRPGARPGDG